MELLSKWERVIKEKFWPSLHPGLVGLFCVVLIATNFLVQWQLTFWHFTITIGLLVYPITFLITDYVAEVHGKVAARRLVWIGLIFAFVPSVFLSTLQITIGSMLAYFVAQFHDVWAFDWWRRRTKGRYLWLRNNASTFVSQALDTVIFSTIAFYSVLETRTIVAIMYSEYPLKLIYALLDTAPLYFFVGLTRNSGLLRYIRGYSNG